MQCSSAKHLICKPSTLDSSTFQKDSAAHRMLAQALTQCKGSHLHLSSAAVLHKPSAEVRSHTAALNFTRTAPTKKQHVRPRFYLESVNAGHNKFQ